ncbi:Nucleolysin TIA-1, putative [Perkinsus marinus ATCC 50983]|uniref:Nucleolysin TIA-1, putative n=1 Tax=Perkinsus marinus (strain ATCC 50983 / TXsc) TaxID=423536 RepID=C5KTC0_PERM5|nr:Nucleolysin TIA-1, putative [Perkinsus marinus ATCC 50983]EER12225.1 Nucleolysin TIA-1, putative [Perkinsus marinus ATCC 50983]|eukprot:XP_002780430.1 Nucleolysin TIA-1, putative [Perkinsus marinus ATCC 50983]
MSPPRDRQSRDPSAVKLSSRTSKSDRDESSTTTIRIREDNDDHNGSTRRQGGGDSSRVGVTLTPVGTSSDNISTRDRKRRSSEPGSGSYEKYDDSNRRRTRSRRDADRGDGDGQSWYKKEGDGSVKREQQQQSDDDDKKPSGGIRASYEAHIDHRGSHNDTQRVEDGSRRGRGRRAEDRSRHSSSREDSRWYDAPDHRHAAESPRRARSRDNRQDEHNSAHAHRYHRSRGREDVNDDEGEEWYSSNNSRWGESKGRSSWDTRGRGKGSRRPPSHRGDSRDFEPRGKIEGSSTVWVGSLPNSITDDEFYDIMSRYGVVEGMKLVALKGFAYVKYTDEESADAAVKALNGEVLVDIAGDKPKHELKTKVDYVEDMGYLHHPYKPPLDKKPDVVHTLFVGNLPVEVTEQDIREFFERDSSISIEQVALRRGSYKQMCYAHVRFGGDGDAEKAVAEFAGDKIIGRNRVRLDWAQDKHMQVQNNEYLRGATPRIYIGNLHDGMSENAIRDALQQAFGTVVAIKLHRDRNGALAYGYITFEDNQTAERAVEEISNIRIANSSIRADFAKLLEPRRSLPGGTRPNAIGHQPQLLGGGYGQQQGDGGGGGVFDPLVTNMYAAAAGAAGAAGGGGQPPPPPPSEGDNAYAPLYKDDKPQRQGRRGGGGSTAVGSVRNPSIERDTNVTWTVPEEFMADDEQTYCSDSDYYYGTSYIDPTHGGQKRRTDDRSPKRRRQRH